MVFFVADLFAVSPSRIDGESDAEGIEVDPQGRF